MPLTMTRSDFRCNYCHTVSFQPFLCMLAISSSSARIHVFAEANSRVLGFPVPVEGNSGRGVLEMIELGQP